MNQRAIERKYEDKFNKLLTQFCELNIDMAKDALEGKDKNFDSKGRLTEEALTRVVYACTCSLAECLNDCNGTEYELIEDDIDEDDDGGCDCEGCKTGKSGKFNSTSLEFAKAVIGKAKELSQEDGKLSEKQLFSAFCAAIKVLHTALNRENGSSFDLIEKGAKKGLEKMGIDPSDLQSEKKISSSDFEKLSYDDKIDYLRKHLNF